MNDDKINVELDKPAIEVMSGIKGPTLADLKEDDTAKTADETTPEPVEEEETDTGGKKMRIPASRWKTLTSRLDQAEAKAEAADELRERLAVLEYELRNRATTTADVPDYWKELYGDSPESKRAYELQERALTEAIAKAQNEAREEERRAIREQAEHQREIEDSFDTQMDDLESELGRDLTDRQKTELLEIVEQYSPTDEEGNFLSFMPISKAYELSQKLVQQNPAKQRMAQIAGASSQGNSSIPDSTPNRPSWDDWRKRFGG